jgi:hypothetical protein
MQVTVKYYDNQSFLIEEVIRQAKNNYGAQAQVSVFPDSDTPIDYLYFAIQRLITGDHLTMLYDSGALYQKDLGRLRAEALRKIAEVLDDVIMENESKLVQED